MAQLKHHTVWSPRILLTSVETQVCIVIKSDNFPLCCVKENTHTRTYSPISKHSDPWRPSAVCARVCLLCAQLRDRWNKCSSLSGVYVFLLQVKVHSFCSLFTTPFVTCDIWATISAFSTSLKIWCHICCRLVVLFCIWRPFTSACSPQLFCHFHFSLNPIM